MRQKLWIISLSILVMAAWTAQAQAAPPRVLNEPAATDYHFLTAEAGFYGPALQQALLARRSKLAEHSEQVGDQVLSAGECIWIASQQLDFGLNPKALLAILAVEGGLERLPEGSLTLSLQTMAAELWDYYSQYPEAGQSLTLSGGGQVELGAEINPATYALARYFAAGAGREEELAALLDRWRTAYQYFFAQDPTLDPVGALDAPQIAPFLRLPFNQPANDFIKVNSFFDHDRPSVFDNALLRFDGLNLTNASFSSCILGVNCYGGHNGIDYSTGAGRPVLAAADGTVVYRYYNTNPAQGTVDSGLILDHGNGYRTSYWHMDPISVSYGQSVTKGQQVGLSGNVGQSTGAHLHFNLRLTSGNKSVDPYGWWSSASDPWGDSQWMWQGNLTADNREAQSQLFYRTYWYRDANGYNDESWWTYSMTSAASSTNWGIWGTYISTPGQYRVYAYWPAHSDSTSDARYKIYHANGVTTVSANQRSGGGQFNSLGVFNFNQGGALVMLTDLSSDSLKRVYFDAVKWERITSSPPTDILLSSTSLAENQPAGALVATLTAVDPDPGDSHTFSLVSGTGSADNGSFSIEGNLLKTRLSFDFETKSSYNIRLRAADSGGLTYERRFTISVIDLNEAPTNIHLSSAAVDENQPPGALVGSLTTSDPDANDSHSYELVSGAGDSHNDLFVIDGESLLSNAVFDYEAQASYSIRLRSTDSGGLWVEKSFAITINDLNEHPPADILLSAESIEENRPAGSLLATLSTQDLDAVDTHTYALVSGPGGADNAAFVIQGNQLKTAHSFDFETQSSYSIRLRSTDRGGLSLEKMFTISVLDVNDPPSDIYLSNLTAAENQPPGIAVGVLSAADQDAGDSHSYSLVSGAGSADNVLFAVQGNILVTAATFDYEARSAYAIRLRATDHGGLSVDKTFTVTITDSNDPPADIRLSKTRVEENRAPGTLVGVLTTIDPDAVDQHTYTLAPGEGSDHNDLFAIQDDRLLTNAVFDSREQNLYSIRVRSVDCEDLSVEKAFIIRINVVDNSPPTDILLSNASVAENQPPGALVGELSSIDLDYGDSHTYDLVKGTGGDDNALFAIQGGRLLTNAVFDFESRAVYSIRLRTTDDSGLSFRKAFIITISDANDPPSGILLLGDSIAENEPPGAQIGVFSTLDQDAVDSYSYELAEGAGDGDNDAFYIQGDTLYNAVAFDYESRTSHTIRVRTIDSGGLTFEEVFIIQILPVNEFPPTDILLANNTVPENQPRGTLVGLLSPVDEDHGDVHSYRLAAGEGDAHNALFRIEDDRLLTNAVFDYEKRDIYSIRLRVTDSGGLWAERAFSIHILDLLEFYLPFVLR